MGEIAMKAVHKHFNMYDYADRLIKICKKALDGE